ncbi:MAG: YheC/YheD family protein [Pseudomonadota bacterium]
MKIFAIINEPFANMALGRNTSLAYILSGVKLGHEVYIYNLAKNFPESRDSSVLALHLTSNRKLCEALIKNHEQRNLEIMECVEKKDLEKLHQLKIQIVSEIVRLEAKTKLKLNEVDFIIQRLEPMKAPFPPAGEKDVNETLKNLKKLFPKLIFNCPINLGDKETPQKINHILKEKIATPTAEFSLDDESYAKQVKSMSAEYKKLYKKDSTKLVFKPKDSAQSLGVFAIEFCENGLDFSALKNQEIAELHAIQVHKIRNNLDEKELKKIIEILCYVQNFKSNKSLRELTRTQILKNAKKLYHGKILVQPFLEGVKSGDIRTNFLKDKKGNFYVAGSTFRKSLRIEDKNFTTTYSTGGATSQPIEVLEKEEIKNLKKKIKMILEVLNGELREKYKNVIELGADFILVGDSKNIFLGELNHHCQALVPVSEAMGRAVDEKAKYGFGLGFTTKSLVDGMERMNWK